MDLPQLTKYLQTQLVIQPRHFMVEYASSAKMKQQYMSKYLLARLQLARLERSEEGEPQDGGQNNNLTICTYLNDRSSNQDTSPLKMPRLEKMKQQYVSKPPRSAPTGQARAKRGGCEPQDGE